MPEAVILLIRSYSELIKLNTFEERFEYLKLSARVGEETFGYDRHINQMFYTNITWRSLREKIIIRDSACDLGVVGYEIGGLVIVHHINPVSLEDLEEFRGIALDPENLICVSHNTHNAIHYGDTNLLPKAPIKREPGDTCLWKRRD